DTNSDDSDSDDNGEPLQELKQDYVYHITGKFALVENDIIDIIITTSKRLKLDADAISVGQPIIHLLGRTMQLPSINETGYTLPIQVKPYLSSAQRGPFDITQPYCEILEFYFINTKIENNSTTSVPWRIEKQDNNTNKPKATNSIRKKIAALKSSSTKGSRSQTSPARTRKPAVSPKNNKNQCAKTLLATKNPSCTVDNIDVVSEEPEEYKDKKATECTIDTDSCDDNNRRDNDEIQEIASSNSENEVLNKNKTNKRTTRRVNNRASVNKRRKVEVFPRLTFYY
ncbi:5316_t:CDS:2, partial [Paraglomus brasilianum]